MARRSPMNKRYQKDAQVGSTRKSAAAAKPKRDAGGTSASSGKSSTAKKSSSARGSSSVRVTLPPDIKRLQKIVFGLLGGAVVLSVVYLWLFKQGGVVGSVVLGVAYALMFTALYLDFTKVRPVVKALQQGKSVGPGKAQKPAKPATFASAAPSTSEGDESTGQSDTRTDERN